MSKLMTRSRVPSRQSVRSLLIWADWGIWRFMWWKLYTSGKCNCRSGWISVISTPLCSLFIMVKMPTSPYWRTLSLYGSLRFQSTFILTPRMTPSWSGMSCKWRKGPIRPFWKSILFSCFTPNLKKSSPELLNAMKCSPLSTNPKPETFIMKSSFWLRITCRSRKDNKNKKGLRRSIRINLSGKIRWRRKNTTDSLQMDGCLEKCSKNQTTKKSKT